MYICKIDKISFHSKIIDAHAHIGNYNGKKYTKSQLDTIANKPLPNNDNIEKVLVSNLDVLISRKDEYTGNREVLLEVKGDTKYGVLLSCSPKTGSVSNIKKLYDENPNSFIGLKFHPSSHDLNVMDSKYEPYIKFAEEKSLPCLFHTAVIVDQSGKIPFGVTKDISDPEYIYNLAKRHKKTPFVLAHMGAGHNMAHDRAIDILLKSIENNDANLYADISWVDIGLEHNGNFPEGEHRSKEHVIKAIKKLKGIGNPNWEYGDQSFRLIFGTDAPIDRFSGEDAIKEYTKFVEDIKFAIRNDNDLKHDAENIIDDLFYNNAKKLYLEKNKNISFKQRMKKIFTKKNILITLSVAAATQALVYINNKRTAKKK